MKDVMQQFSGQAGRVGISPNLRKESEHIDGYGNVIDPVTKQIIRRNSDSESLTEEAPAE